MIVLAILFDSLFLFTSSLNVTQWYWDQGYVVEAYYEASSDPWALTSRATGTFWEHYEEKDYRVSQGMWVHWPSLPDDWYRIQYNEHEFLQREMSTEIMNMAAPLQAFDTRIKPSRIVRMYKFRGENYGDVVLLYIYYDPWQESIATKKQKEVLHFLNGERIDQDLYEDRYQKAKVVSKRINPFFEK